MVEFRAEVLRFEKMGEKTGWYYLSIPSGIASKLKPGEKRSFRVKGMLDDFGIMQTALLPMGNGDFILPFNAGMRKGTGKSEGDFLIVSLEHDSSEIPVDGELMMCLEDDPPALEHFMSLAPGHRRYFSNWVTEAKTVATRSKRIAMAVNALSRGLGFPEMLREKKNGR